MLYFVVTSACFGHLLTSDVTIIRQWNCRSMCSEEEQNWVARGSLPICCGGPGAPGMVPWVTSWFFLGNSFSHKPALRGRDGQWKVGVAHYELTLASQWMYGSLCFLPPGRESQISSHLAGLLLLLFCFIGLLCHWHSMKKKVPSLLE